MQLPPKWSTYEAANAHLSELRFLHHTSPSGLHRPGRLCHLHRFEYLVTANTMVSFRAILASVLALASVVESTPAVNSPKKWKYDIWIRRWSASKCGDKENWIDQKKIKLKSGTCTVIPQPEAAALQEASQFRHGYTAIYGCHKALRGTQGSATAAIAMYASNLRVVAIERL